MAQKEISLGEMCFLFAFSSIRTAGTSKEAPLETSRSPGRTHLHTAPVRSLAFSVRSFNTVSQSSLAAWDSFRLNGGLNRSPFLNTLGQRAAW